MAIGFQAGLRDVIAANSAICEVDGAAGRLRYRGYDIADLAAQTTYEEVAHLLWFGELPERNVLERFTRELSVQRALPDPVVEAMRCGTPCILSDTSSLPEVSGGAALCAGPAGATFFWHCRCHVAGDQCSRSRHCSAIQW